MVFNIPCLLVLLILVHQLYVWRVLVIMSADAISIGN